MTTATEDLRRKALLIPGFGGNLNVKLIYPNNNTFHRDWNALRLNRRLVGALVGSEHISAYSVSPTSAFGYLGIDRPRSGNEGLHLGSQVF